MIGDVILRHIDISVLGSVLQVIYGLQEKQFYTGVTVRVIHTIKAES